ncbi:MAG: S49 family peptidase [bacterium]|nr:S49 family peptidase [bacterium]
MFGKVVNILPWIGKKNTDAAVNSVNEGTASDASTAATAGGTHRLTDMSVDEFERALMRIEVAKIREQHVGINRNRGRRLLRAVGVVAAGAFLLSFFFAGDPDGKPPIDKTPIVGVSFPVIGALPGATRTGHIAAIKLSGGIDGTLHGEPLASNTPLYLQTAFAVAEADPDLAGVILEIDSPGGGVSASEQSYRIVKAAKARLEKRKIKVIAYTSLGAYSGGYYIAMGVGHGNFFADPGASVANIGVIMSMYNTAVLGELLGITENIVKTGPIKSTGAQWEKLTPEQRAMLQESVDDSFKLFLGAVSESRDIDLSTLVRESQLPVGRTNGAWFSARRALEKKLIDGIVPVEDLYKAQASALPDRGQFKNVEFVEFQPRLSTFEKLTSGTGKAVGAFLRYMTSEMNHRDAPLRSERE